MKKVNRLCLTMMLALTLLLPSLSFAESSYEGSSDIMEYVEAMQPGWNLGNTFDAVGADETAWGNPYVTHDLIKNIAAQGFKSIRIPVTFDKRMADGPDYTIDEQFLTRLDQAIQWSLDEGLYVMINIHHDSWIWLEAGMQEDHDRSLARFKAIWTQLANRYKEASNKLMFESINEPRFWGSDEEKLNYVYELNDAFYNLVRNSGGKNNTRPLVLPTLDTGSDQHKVDALYTQIKELKDPYVIATVHYYGFWQFSVNIAGFTTFNEETKNSIITTFDRVHDKFVADGIPVIIGEFGLLGFDTDLNAIQQGEKLKFFEFMLDYAKQKKLAHMLWDNGQHFGRTTFKWSDLELFTMMKTSWTTRSATANTDTVFVDADAAIEDVNLDLQLNGNQVSILKHDANTLVNGQDYELNGSTLTLKSSLIKKLASSEALGRNATISIEFNNGKNWNVYVVSYRSAQLNNIVGTKSQFKIPVSFNGDQLATMEAVYEDGSNAGPHNWTSFKEFSYTFKPSYGENTLALTDKFFNEVKDGKVKLTLHFWSGEKQEYYLVRSGDLVIGSTTNNLVSYQEVSTHWAKDSIYRALQLGLVNGFSDGTFRPNQSLNRAELAVMIGRILKLSPDTNGKTEFADNASIPAYAKPYVTQLADQNIINGYEDQTFRPAEQISRAELAVLIARALKLEGTATSSFADQATIPAWAAKEIALLAKLNLMTGNDNGIFSPNNSATRAEAVTVLVRVWDMFD